MASFQASFLNVLRKQGKIDEQQYRQAQKEITKETDIDGYLLDKQWVEDSDLAAARAAIFDMEVAQVSEQGLTPEVLEQIPENISRRYQIIPLAKEGRQLKVGMVHPEDIRADEVLDFLEHSRNLQIKRFVISAKDFEEALAKQKGLESEVEKALEGLEGEPGEDEGQELKISSDEKEIGSLQELRSLAEKAPITRVVRIILKYAVDARASDIHIEPLSKKVQVRFRVDGKLHASLFLPKGVLSAIVTRVKILAKLKIDETRVPQDGRIHSEFDKRQIDFRVSTFPTTEGEKVVLRVLDMERGIMELEELGLQGKALKDIEKAMQQPFGTTLISGPTGSGKTTTLYSVLRKINTEDVNIVTLEDPVEYYMEGVSQSQVRPEIGYNFASGLRHVLRQDPDILMVGEIRDNETAELAIHAALTGHLVFSTIHTNDAIGVIPRLIDMGVDDFLIPSALTLAVAQRLVGKLCQECMQKYEPPAGVKKMLEQELSDISAGTLKEMGIEDFNTLWKAEGCSSCNGQGTQGRIAVFETLFMTEQLEEIVVSEPTHAEISKEASRQEMLTMRQDGLIKAMQGKVALDDVLRATEEE